MTMETGAARRVVKIVPSVQPHEGVSFLVHRPFPGQAMAAPDPFLLLDEMGPVALKPSEAKGAWDHPHRGFETVTYMLEGGMEHRDSQGNAGSLTPGDVQWMTAFTGVVHSEMPAEDFLPNGGRMHGFQLWVNLARRDEIMAPCYQEIPGRSISQATSADGRVWVRMIAGESLGACAVLETRMSITYLHFFIQPCGKVSQTVPAGYNAPAFGVEGSGASERPASPARYHDAVIFDIAGDLVEIEGAAGVAEPWRVLLLAGQPVNEPISRYGAFGMNTREEIYQAMDDYDKGRMGAIPAAVKRM